ncbi:MAG: YopX family protein [Candidatus Babeliales bacterium]|nr:YopX family protein [Candidatus Babeliales bacterium]
MPGRNSLHASGFFIFMGNPKFKIFDHISKKFVEGHQFPFGSDNGIFINPDDGEVYKISDGEDGWHRQRVNEINFNGEFLFNVEIVELTPLKDKNGNGIYRGDILRDPLESDWDKVNFGCFEVFFHDGDTNSDYNIGYSMNRMHNHGAVCGGYIPAFKPKNTKKMIVIGNIFENPELLK